LNRGRTILAILLGYLALILLEVLGGAFLYVFHLSPGSGAAVVGGEFTVFLSGIAAGAITARIAPARGLSHATALGLAIVSATTLAAAIARPPHHDPYPLWYPYALGIFAGVGAFVGGALVARRFV
jgi:hypothetical protein